MNTRILVIDDSPKTKEDTCDVLEAELRKNQFPHPEAVWLNTHDFPEDQQLLNEVLRLAASDRWDSVIVDINLGRSSEEMPRLLLPFQIIEAFRRENSLAMAFIFSGTIEAHLRKLFKHIADDAPNSKKNEAERHLRSLWHNQIVGFFRRDQIVESVVGELRSPPWMLKLEREAAKLDNLFIDWTSLGHGLGNPKAQVLTFKNLSEAMRQRGRFPKDIANQVMLYGFAAVTEVYQLEEIRNKRVVLITAECDDLQFVDGVVATLKQQMPHLDRACLQYHQQPHEQLAWIPADVASVVVFMLHGGDGYLKGADPSVGSTTLDEIRWMNEDKDRALIAGKVVYCFSCNSQTLAAEAVKSGAKAFIGFPDIPFYRFDDEVPRKEPELTDALQHLYARLTETVLLRWFMGRDTIEQMVEFVKVTVRKLTILFVQTNQGHPFRNEVVSMFEKIANGVMFQGDPDWVFPGN